MKALDMSVPCNLARKRWAIGFIPTLVAALLLSIGSAAAQTRSENAGDADDLLELVIGNTLRDLRGLPNLVLEQSMASKWRTHEAWADHFGVHEPDQELSEVFETVIAGGKVYVRRIQRDGKPVNGTSSLVGDEAETGKAPDLLATLLFGMEVPFEAIPTGFKVTGKKENPNAHQLMISIGPKDDKGPYKATTATLSIDTATMRVTQAEYRLQKDPSIFLKIVEVQFDLFRGYWLPTLIRTTGKNISGSVLLESENRISYRKFEVSSRVVN